MHEKNRMVIANRLRDGFTVFLGEGDAWVTFIGDGLVVGTADAAAALLEAANAAAARNIVVSPYLIAVTEDGCGRRPVDWRESIRAFGPTVGTGPGA